MGDTGPPTGALPDPTLQSILDALIDSTALVDTTGMIRMTNRAWIRFATENGGSPEEMSVGANYLQVCDDAAARGSADAKAAADCLRRVMDGRIDQAFLEYECSSPTERRWYLLRVAAVDGRGEPLMMASHLDVTRRHQAERIASLVLPAGPGADGSLSELMADSVLSALTHRERNVVAKLMAGYPVSRIAERYVVSESTIRSQLSSAFKKLGVSSQHELIELIRSKVVNPL